MTLYYGARAICITRQELTNEKVLVDKANAELPDKVSSRFQKWDDRTVLLTHYPQSVIFNMICSAAGFAALYEIARIFASLDDVTKIDAGTGLFLGFLTLVAILGISGKLTETLHHGKVFGK